MKFVWWVFIAFVLSFDPLEHDFQILPLLSNVPEKALMILSYESDNRLDMLNFIDYSKTFIKKFDKFKYILHVDEQTFQDLNQHMTEISKSSIPFQWAHSMLVKVRNQLRLINQIITRHKIYNIYLLRTKKTEFLMLIQSNSGFSLHEINYWISTLQSHKFKNGRSWCSNISYFQVVKFVKVGDEVWRTCEELEDSSVYSERGRELEHDEL